MTVRTLVSYVGYNDPYGKPGPSGEPTTGPVLSVLEHLEAQGKLPERVILLVTKTHRHRLGYEQEGMEARAEEVNRAIVERYGERIRVEVVLLEVNPADLDEVIEATLAGLHGKLTPEEEVHINVSSGTQAMSAAIVFLADSGHIPHHCVWQSLDPTKLPPGVGRVKRVNLAYLSEGRRLDRALDFLSSMSFSYAQRAFEEMATNSLIPERRPKAAAAATLMQAYAFWDRADFAGALRAFENAKGHLQKLKGWERIPHLDEQEEVLKRLVEDHRIGRETQAFLEDMYAAVERRMRSGQFLNVPTRARRLYEGILNFLLYEEGLEAGDWEELGEKMQALRGLAEDGVLFRLGADKETQERNLKKMRDCYRKFAEARNSSYEVHGLGNVGEGPARSTLDAVGEMMRILFPEFDPKGYPFGAVALEEVAQGLREWFAISP